MAVTNYYSINGVITGEEVVGGSRTDYLTDALGSVVATVNASAQVVNTYRYKPYGSLLAQTGGGSDSSFQWVGSQGYRQTGKSYSEVYIRRRHYSSALGRWTTQDPLRLGSHEINLYQYVESSPLTNNDPSGLQPRRGPWPMCCPDPTPQDYLDRPSDRSEGEDLLPETRNKLHACLDKLKIPWFIAQGIGNDYYSFRSHHPDGRCDGKAFSAAIDLAIPGLVWQRNLTPADHDNFCKLLLALRQCGFAAWHRVWTPTAPENEIHLIDPAAPCMKEYLRGQVNAYLRGRDGTKRGRDRDGCGLIIPHPEAVLGRQALAPAIARNRRCTDCRTGRPCTLPHFEYHFSWPDDPGRVSIL